MARGLERVVGSLVLGVWALVGVGLGFMRCENGSKIETCSIVTATATALTSLHAELYFVRSKFWR